MIKIGSGMVINHTNMGYVRGWLFFPWQPSKSYQISFQTTYSRDPLHNSIVQFWEITLNRVGTQPKHALGHILTHVSGDYIETPIIERTRIYD